MNIELIVRGACALRPGVPGVSSRIRVRSIVGRFLEHSRIAVFANGGHPELYLGSADWMPRNLYERVEVMFRLKDPEFCRHVCTTILAPYFVDTEKSRLLLADGNYIRAYEAAREAGTSNGTRFSAQDFMMEMHGEPADSLHGSPRLPKSHERSLAEILELQWTPPEAPPDSQTDSPE